jgi:hypothetical protein
LLQTFLSSGGNNGGRIVKAIATAWEVRGYTLTPLQKMKINS